MKSILLIIVLTLFISCKPNIQDNVHTEPAQCEITPVELPDEPHFDIHIEKPKILMPVGYYLDENNYLKYRQVDSNVIYDVRILHDTVNKKYYLQLTNGDEIRLVDFKI